MQEQMDNITRKILRNSKKDWKRITKHQKHCNRNKVASMGSLVDWTELNKESKKF